MFQQYIAPIWAIAVALLAVPTAALAPQDARDVNVSSVVELPMESLNAVESNGEIVFISGNGRFVIKGQLVDVWYKHSLDTMEEIKDVSERIHIGKMNLDIPSLNTLTLGSGDQTVTIFVDPQCPSCHNLIDDAEELARHYTFNLVVVPALGDESNRISRHLFCSTASNEDKLMAFRENNIMQLTSNSGCDISQYDQTLMTAHMLGLKGVPFLISPDGRVHNGRPGQLKQWLGDK